MNKENRIKRIKRKLVLKTKEECVDIILCALEAIELCSDALLEKAISMDTQAMTCMNKITKAYTKILGSLYSNNCSDCYYDIDCGEYKKNAVCEHLRRKKEC